MNDCPMWDEYNNSCMWERLEKIFQYPWEDGISETEIEACFEEMP